MRDEEKVESAESIAPVDEWIENESFGSTAAAACFKKDAFAEHAEETIKRIHEEVMNDSFQNNA